MIELDDMSWEEKAEVYANQIFGHFKVQVDEMLPNDQVDRALALLAISNWICDGKKLLISEGESDPTVAMSFLVGYVIGRRDAE